MASKGKRANGDGLHSHSNAGYHSSSTDVTVPMDELGQAYGEDQVYFKDKSKGRKRIDYVIVSKSKKDGKKDLKKSFQKNLSEELDFEVVTQKSDSDDNKGKKTTWLKLHVKWATMLKYAEILKFKKPIKEVEEDERSCLQKLQECLSAINPFKSPIPSGPKHVTQVFTIERTQEFFTFHNKVHSEDGQGDIHQSFFTPTERNRVIHEILRRTAYDKKKVGLDNLIKDGWTGFPLHDGKYKSEEYQSDNNRSILYKEWARPGRWYKKQPLDAIRNYFGEKIGMYFAWLGFYTQMLGFASIVGILAFVYGCLQLYWGNAEVSNDLCEASDPGTFTMCPQCSDPNCPYWLLSSSCIFAKLTYLFDNEATVVFAAFMSLWATTFCEFWKRQQHELDYKWDLFGFQQQGENVRQEYITKAGRTKRKNPVTKIDEAYISLLRRSPRIVLAILTITFMICLVIAAVLGIIVYRIAVKVVFFTLISDETFSVDFEISSQASLLTSITASLISLVIIMILQLVYNGIATLLTDLELHRTDTDYENSYTFKMYLFAFVNYYSSSFYIAFFKGRLPGNPSDYGKIFGFRQEECDPAGCMQELFINIAIVMCGKQFFNNVIEIARPLIKNYCRRCRSEVQEDKEQWERDLLLEEQSPHGLFEEYLEMAVQFGFTTIFVAAFPLAPFFALLNNLMEIRLDAFKFVTQLRRPYAARAQDIGAWYPILVTIGNLSVLTNACIVAFTSEFIPRQVYRYTAGEGSLTGYMNFSLSYFDPVNFEEVNGNKGPSDDTYPVLDQNSTYYNKSVEICRYRGFYYGPDSDTPYKPTMEHWRIIALKLVFVLLYEHIIYMLKFILNYMIPDIPEHVNNALKHENYLAQKALSELATKHSKATQEQGVSDSYMDPMNC